MGKAVTAKKKAAVKKDAARWKPEPEEHDFPAALDYLSLLMKPELASRVVDELRKATATHRKARDLLRASELLLLPASNPAVARDLKKVRQGIKLSPVLLLRGDPAKGRRLMVADGYHRICASYSIDENLDIPCRIVDLPAR